MTNINKIIEGVRAGTVDEAYAAPFLLDEIDRLRDALKPFARTEVWQHIDDDATVTRSSTCGVRVSAGAFRRACAVLAEVKA